MIGTQGGKILLKDGKVQRGCECCGTNCSTMRIRNAGDTAYLLLSDESVIAVQRVSIGANNNQTYEALGTQIGDIRYFTNTPRTDTAESFHRIDWFPQPEILGGELGESLLAPFIRLELTCPYSCGQAAVASFYFGNTFAALDKQSVFGTMLNIIQSGEVTFAVTTNSGQEHLFDFAGTISTASPETGIWRSLGGGQYEPIHGFAGDCLTRKFGQTAAASTEMHIQFSWTHKNSTFYELELRLRGVFDGNGNSVLYGFQDFPGFNPLP